MNQRKTNILDLELNLKEREIEMKQIIVIDCQHDFIEGTLACHYADEAVKKIVDYVDHNECQVFYSLDWHTYTNESFLRNGGIWPDHCVQNTWGASLDARFFLLESKPNQENCYYKGKEDTVEEYSAYYAINRDGKVLHEKINDEVIVCGIASEYCVMETVRELLKGNKRVSLLRGGLGYVDLATHKEALKIYDQLGVDWVE